jgi:LacI family transcriptional regulator, galactose operon repressor
LGQFLKDQIPLVVLQYELPGVAADIVQVDNVDIGRQATDHLQEHGHAAIGCVAGPGAAARIRGYREALMLQGRTMHSEPIQSADATVAEGQAAAAAMLSQARRPTAIFATNGLMAAGALRAARDLGLRVPEDLAIVAADDSYVSIVTTPTITTVGLPADELARLGMGMLLDRIRGVAKPTPRQLTLKASLTKRESCGCTALSELDDGA